MSQILSAIWLSLETGFFMFWETLWPLVLGFGLSGAVQSFASRSEMQRLMGDSSPRSLARASFFGMISSSCSYAASAMAKSLFQKGADFTTAMVFMLASTNLVLELGLVLWILIGWQFALAEYVGGILMIGFLALVARVFFKPRLVEAARARLNGQAGPMTGHESHGEGAGGTNVPLRQRLRSASGWADAASYAMADLTMLRKEMAIGYLVAGFLAVLVPNWVWNLVFFRGHGIWTAIENVIVGPIIAIVSFVCSIGNVPLAAALWTGGISFGGVVSFIFADLITLPLILIYRKLYGWSLTWRLVAAFWLVMSAAGLVTELLFGSLNLVPSVRPIQPVPIGFQWNYTTVLNIIFLGVFAGLYWLYRNRARFGGGAQYAIDPVCGMQVQKELAPARTVQDGQTVFFCSDHCRERFEKAPARFGASIAGTPPIATISGNGDVSTAIDPVCGMTVKKVNAAATRTHQGQTRYFCMEGCAESFAKDPDKYLKTNVARQTLADPLGAGVALEAAVDPVCGMTVDKATAVATRVHRGQTFYFCMEGCAQSFEADPGKYSVPQPVGSPDDERT